MKVWFYVRHSPFTVSQIDNLFALPSLFPTLALSFSTALPLVPMTIALAIVMQGLDLISILAPNSLVVTSAGMIPSQMEAVMVDFYTVPLRTPIIVGRQGSYIAPSARFGRVVQEAILSEKVLPWPIPENCGTSCNYTIQLDAPAAKCRDIPAYQIQNPSRPEEFDNAQPAQAYLSPHAIDIFRPQGLHAAFFNSSSSLGYRFDYETSRHPTLVSTAVSLSRWFSGQPQTNGHHIWFAYEEAARVRGTICEFVYATYDVHAAFANNTQSVVGAVTSYHEPISDDKWWDASSPIGSTIFNVANLSGRNPPSSPVLYALSARSMIECFAAYLSGTFYGTGQFVPTAFHTTVGFTKLFTQSSDALGYGGLKPAVNNLTEGFTDLFAQTVLSFLSQSARSSLDLTDNVIVQGYITPPEGHWQYSAASLWLVYGVGLLITALSDVGGIYCLLQNGASASTSFSNIVATTRTRGLDRVFEGGDSSSTVAGSPHGMPGRMSRRVMDTKLQFGVISGSEHSSDAKVGFAVSDTEIVKPLTRRRRASG